MNALCERSVTRSHKMYYNCAAACRWCTRHDVDAQLNALLMLLLLLLRLLRDNNFVCMLHNFGARANQRTDAQSRVHASARVHRRRPPDDPSLNIQHTAVRRRMRCETLSMAMDDDDHGVSETSFLLHTHTQTRRYNVTYITSARSTTCA